MNLYFVLRLRILLEEHSLSIWRLKSFMFQKKIAVTLIALALSCAFIFTASAQWTPGGLAINFAGFDLGSSGSAPAGSSGIKPYMIGLGNEPVVGLLSNNSTANSSSIDSTGSLLPALPVADLSGYGKDRRDKNLARYTNIMYPLAESAGFTATAAGGSGGGGCGCGGG